MPGLVSWLQLPDLTLPTARFRTSAAAQTSACDLDVSYLVDLGAEGRAA